MKMMEIQRIRKAFFEEGLNKNQISKQFHRSWETVDRIISSSIEELEEEKKRERIPTVGTFEVTKAIKEMLENEKTLRIRKKQRLTAKVIYEELVKRRIYSGSIRRLEELVKKEKEKIGVMTLKSCLPLHFPLGSALQIDHGQVECIIAKQLMICYLYVASVPGTSLRYYQLFPKKTREMWGEFHERTFSKFGGIFPKVAYDNDTVLITDVKGKVQTEFADHLMEHYGFEPHYCNPSSGNEKGSVEKGVGYGQQNYFTGRPEYPDFATVNKELDERFLLEISTGKDTRTERPFKSLLEEMSTKLLPLLPCKKWHRKDKRVVNSYQHVEIEGNFYSVPEKHVGHIVYVYISSFSIEIQGDGDERIIHSRGFMPGNDSLHWDHYLDPLQKKPGALWDCRATQHLLEDPLIAEAWGLALEGHTTKREAQKTFIEILLLKRTYPESCWRNGLERLIKMKRIRSAELTTVLKMGQEEDVDENSKRGIREHLKEKMPHLVMEDVECSITSYNILCEEGASC